MEAAALAGAMDLCGEDPLATAQRIAEENGIPANQGELTINPGYYDEQDQHIDFTTYKDFTEEGNIPAGEYVNAVQVVYRNKVQSLTGMGQNADVSTAAVAYLKRIDIVSLDPEGGINIGNDSIWEDVVFFSNGYISYPQAITLNKTWGTAKTYAPPDFNNCRLYAAGQVLSSLSINTSSDFLGNQSVSKIFWDSGVPQSGNNIFSGVDPITSIRPVDDACLEEWRDRADIVYTPDQTSDNVFYHKTGSTYYLDLTGLSGVIFFDGEETADQNDVMIRPPPQSNGTAITDLTFVTNCSVVMRGIPGMDPASLYVGGEDEDQAMFISGRNIEIQPVTGGNIEFRGAVFRTGGDFILYHKGGSFDHYIRIIADGSVRGRSYLTNYARGNVDIGLFTITNNSRFGPPCPPVMARLGRLEATEE